MSELIAGHRVIVFAPEHNSGSKRDATGAFQPEARAFAARHGVPAEQVVLFDNHMAKKHIRENVLLNIGILEKPPLTVAFFCHGWRTGVQCGFDLGTVADLAQALSGTRHIIVALYACSTAQGADGGEDAGMPGGDGGFADRLRDELCRAGAVDCQVDAHSTAGHTTRNPYVRRFQGMGSPYGGVGGYMVVSPAKKPLWNAWRTMLRDTGLRYDFPFMPVADIHRWLLLNG